jgi:hypothetical protein
MMMNSRQEELMHEFVRTIGIHFPSVEYLGYHGSPYGENDVWIDVAVPDEETMLALSEFSPALEMDILLKYGYRFSFMPHIANLTPQEPLEEAVFA